MRPRSVVLSLALALASALLAPRAAMAADPPAEAIHFSYAAPADCPAEAELVAAVADMGGAFREAAPAEAARRFDVLVARTPAGFSGSLSVHAPAGGDRVRTVTCAHCASVVRALGLIMAMTLADGPPPAAPAAEKPAPSEAPEAPEPPPPEPPYEPERTTTLGPPDDSGGIAAMALWGNFAWSPSGAGVMAVARSGGTHFGASAALTSVDVSDTSQADAALKPTVASGHGPALRLGAIAAWGAPWSREDWVGFVAEAGVRASVVHGAVWPLAQAGQFCASYAGAETSFDCTTGSGTPTTWRSLSPYVAGTFVVQIVPKLPARPFVGLTLVWSGNYKGDSGTFASFDAGFAWRSW